MVDAHDYIIITYRDCQSDQSHSFLSGRPVLAQHQHISLTVPITSFSYSPTYYYPTCVLLSQVPVHPRATCSIPRGIPEGVRDRIQCCPTSGSSYCGPEARPSFICTPGGTAWLAALRCWRQRRPKMAARCFRAHGSTLLTKRTTAGCVFCQAWFQYNNWLKIYIYNIEVLLITLEKMQYELHILNPHACPKSNKFKKMLPLIWVLNIRLAMSREEAQKSNVLGGDL